MAVDIVWDNDEQTILRYDVEGHWTWDQFMIAYKKGLDMLTHITHRVDFMVNPLDSKSRGYVPSNMIFHVVTLHRNAPPNVGLTAVIGGSGFFKTLNELNRRLYPRIAERFVFIESLDEARAVLKAKTSEATLSEKRIGRGFHSP